MDGQEIERSGQFGPVAFQRYEWEQPYTTAEYLDVLLTYSGHRALAPAARRHLLDAIARLIDSRYGGRITKRYLTEVRVAHRLRERRWPRMAASLGSSWRASTVRRVEVFEEGGDPPRTILAPALPAPGGACLATAPFRSDSPQPPPSGARRHGSRRA
jgi:hypothetical protein